jgi:hypothetical protein
VGSVAIADGVATVVCLPGQVQWAEFHACSSGPWSAKGSGGLLVHSTDRVAARPRLPHVDSRFVPENRRVQRAKARVGGWLRRRPRLFWTLVLPYRSAQRLRCRCTRLVCRPPRDSFLDPDRLLTVPPTDIEFKTLLPGSALRGRGCGWVLDGDWDAHEHPFMNDRRYRAVRDVVSRGLGWKDTEEYAEAVDTLKKGIPVRHCWTGEDLDRRYEALDRLVEAIRRDGYLTQRELRRGRTREAQLGRQDDISVAIGRDGDILYRDGAHRLAIAKLVGTPLLPVEVEVRHAGWMEFRLEIELYAARHGRRVPQPLLHPDLDDIPADPSCQRRIGSVLGSLPATCTVLDLAPGWGYFCQRLEAEGFSCTALKPSSDAGYFLERLRRACNRTFAIVSKEELDGLPARDRRFDAGLLMSDGLDAAEGPSLADVLDSLRSASVRQLFVEPNAVVVRAATADDGPRDPEGLLEKLATVTGLRDIVRVGWSSGPGPLYRLC